MRTIKFRGKRVDNGEWVYGDLYQEKHPYKNEIKEVMIVEYRPDLRLVSGAPSNNHWWREVDPLTIGQFTGLTDKNGKEIYEGDVYTDKTKRKYLIVFRNGSFLKDNGHSRFEINESEIRAWGGEIIGNIHDNPELLTTREE